MQPNSSAAADHGSPTQPPEEEKVSILGQKTLVSLANLLPTGTVMAFQTLAPAFSNKGECRLSNGYLTVLLIAVCSVVCFVSSFTDSFTDSDGKLRYGIATRRGLVVLNRGGGARADLSRFKMRWRDVVHATVSMLVFWAFALCDDNVQRCFLPFVAASDLDVIVVNLPLAAGLFSTFFFVVFPTTRRGIGYSDVPAKP